MPVEIIDASRKLVQVKIRGVLTKADHERIMQVAKEAIAREEKVRALAILDGFEGWERHGGWGEVSFMMEEGQHIEKWPSSAMKNGATTRWHLPPKDFAPPSMSSGVTHE
jgi:hypothetical protein